MTKKRRIIYLLVIAILCLSFVQVYADNLDNLRKEQRNVEKQIKNTQKQIKNIENQTKDVSKQIQDLDRKVDKATTDLEKVEKELDQIEKNIEKTTLELEEAEENLEERKDTFNQRIRVMYMNGDTGYLELLLSSSDIKDFLSRKDVVKSIAEHDKKLIKFMKEQRDLIDEKKTELEAQRASVEVTKSKIEARKKELDRVSREKQELMGRLKEDVKSLEKEYDKLNDYAKEIESKIIKLQRNTGPYSGGKMAWPVPGYNKISSYYGYRIHPIFKTKKLHTGIDIPAPTGTAITAAAAGTVIYSDWLGGYGKVVMIDHGGGIVTLYAHNSSLVASTGQVVSRGDTVSKAGSTGVSTGPHLHFEVRKNGAYVDPITWLRGN